jgi:hypothetical protein
MHHTNPISRDTPAKTREFDPTGKSNHEPGAKLDAGKVRPSLILSAMPMALLEVARVGTYGADKYSDGGWQHVDNGFNRYTDAMDRHRLKETIEGRFDHDILSETGEHIYHAAQVAWNALARLELMLREEQGLRKC